MKDKRYKLYFDTERKPVKLTDLKNDKDEKINIINKPEVKSILSKLSQIEKQWPTQDAAPKYTPNPPQKWDVKIKN